MNISELIKQFKSLEPDAHYSEQSKRAILATMQTPAPSPRKVTVAVLHLIETAAAVVFAGFFVLLITGAFSVSRLAPVELRVVDTRTFHAEAQAIDMQIQLANLNYEESSVPAAIASPKRASTLAAPGSSDHATSTPTSTLSVTDALRALAQ